MKVSNRKILYFLLAILLFFISGVVISYKYIHSHQTELVNRFLKYANEEISKQIQTSVDIEQINIDEYRNVHAKNVTIFDSNNEPMFVVGEADVELSLLSTWKNLIPAIRGEIDPVSTIKTVTVRDVDINIVQREDGSWNFRDIKSSGEERADFRADVIVENAHARLGLFQEDIDKNFDDENTKVLGATFKEIELNNIYSEVNCANFPDGLIKIENANADILDANVNLEGLIDLENSRQVAIVDVQNVDAEKFFYLIPDGLIPDNLEINSAHIERSRLDISNRNGDVRFTGDAKYSNASGKINNLIAENVRGTANFSNDSIRLSTDLSARLEDLQPEENQNAHVYGTIRLDTDEVYFDLNASANDLNPAKVIENIPVDVNASTTAHILGTAKNPTIDGEVYIPSLNYQGVSVENISSHVRYENSAVYLSDINAETFDGTLNGEGSLKASDLSYTAHVQMSDIDIDRISNDLEIPALSDVSGKISADLGIHGVSDDLESIEIYGSAKTSNAQYQIFKIENADGSFHARDKELIIDYLSVQLPNHSSIGIEGNITNGDQLDFNFYAGHVDLNMFEPVLKESINNPEIETTLSGLSDFKGTIKGSTDNPEIDLKFSAVSLKNPDGTTVVQGELFKQEYDSLKLNASGSLDEITIDDFHFEKDGKDIWLASGTVGLIGDKNINIRIDTVGTRAESITSVFENSPTLDGITITGNVDNVITVTGTLEKPDVVGYVHFWRGSYNGIILTGLDGDYFVEGDLVRVQDFHIQSPMVDMVVNGTINRKTLELDFRAETRDLNARRFQAKLPKDYIVEGHGNFAGLIKGTIEQPIFDGFIMSDSLMCNGVELTDVRGHIHYEQDDIDLQEFTFKQDDGSYNLTAYLENYNGINGNVTASNVSVKELAALCNQKNDVFDGKLNANISIANTLRNPTMTIQGEIPRGELAGYELHDLVVDLSLVDNLLQINKVEGYQGSTAEAEEMEKGSMIERILREKKLPTVETRFEGQGYFKVTGQTKNAMNDGSLDFQITAKNIDMGMVAKTAGSETEVVGTADLEAVIDGRVSNPHATAEVHAYNGGIRGSSFDRINGSFELKDGLIHVLELAAEETIDNKIYKASTTGILPIVALTAKSKNDLRRDEQIYLIVSVDEADLSMLPVLSKQISWAMGGMGGKLVITGTLNEPDINGTISINEGVTKFKLLEKPIEHINTIIDFEDSKMKIATCTGNIGRGTYNITGGMSLENLELTDYEFALAADGLELRMPFFRGDLTLNLKLTEESIFHGMRVLPKIAGNINLDNCIISVPSVPTDDSELPNILLDIDLNLGSKVHFYSAYLYDMYLNGSVNFAGGTLFPKTSGAITVKNGGTINYLKTPFKIKEGEANFNQIGTFFPSLNFFAETRLTQARVFISLNGTLDNMEFKLGSSPEMNETEIIQLLTFRNAYQSGQDIDMGDLLTIGLQMSVLSEVEAMMRKTLYLDQFAVSRGSGSAFESHTAENSTDNDDEYNVQLGKYIGDNVLLKYTQGIGGDHIHRYGVQYEFTDNFAVSIEREGGEYYFGLEARIKF